MSIIPNINNKALQLLPDIALWKQQIADAINYKGGEAEATQAFSTLAEEIKDIPNFNTNGCEYISEVYKPTTLLEAYYNRLYIKSVVDNYVKEISGSSSFSGCTSLQNVNMPSLVTISGSSSFSECTSLQTVNMPSLVTISGRSSFSECTSLQTVNMPSLVTISGSSSFYGCTSLQNVNMPQVVSFENNDTFRGLRSLVNVVFGSLTRITRNTIDFPQPNLRNITIGQNSNVNLPFHNWEASNVINEGQSGIDELNSNLYNNLLTKLYDHSNDGETRILQIGWLDHITPENIAYANAKGWTITN